MKKSLRMLELIAVALALFSAIGCGKLRARDQLNKGVQSYKNGKYEDAIDHFQRAVSFDSGLIVARLYLATAYADRKSTRLNSSHQIISYAVFCLKKNI